MTLPVTVCVLHDAVADPAPPDALDTLAQVDAVAAALRASGYRVEFFGVTMNLEALRNYVLEHPADVYFNLVESPGGSDRLAPMVPALLEKLEVSFTGSGYSCMLQLADKVQAKRWLRFNGILTPEWWSLEEEAPVRRRSWKWIVKSLYRHASFGLDDGSVVDSIEKADKRIREAEARLGGRWFAERFIPGREFNMALLETREGVRVLPQAEILFVDFPADMPQIVDYSAKWDPESFAGQRTVRHFPEPKLNRDLHDDLVGTAIECWEAFQLRGYARVDLRVDAAGQPWVIDINANPCLTPDAGYAAAAERYGMNYEQLIQALVTPLLPAVAEQANE